MGCKRRSDKRTWGAVLYTLRAGGGRPTSAHLRPLISRSSAARGTIWRDLHRDEGAGVQDMAGHSCTPAAHGMRAQLVSWSPPGRERRGLPSSMAVHLWPSLYALPWLANGVSSSGLQFSEVSRWCGASRLLSCRRLRKPVGESNPAACVRATEVHCGESKSHAQSHERPVSPLPVGGATLLPSRRAAGLRPQPRRQPPTGRALSAWVEKALSSPKPQLSRHGAPAVRLMLAYPKGSYPSRIRLSVLHFPRFDQKWLEPCSQRCAGPRDELKLQGSRKMTSD